jgi:hypothetical protein
MRHVLPQQASLGVQELAWCLIANFLGKFGRLLEDYEHGMEGI